MTKVFLHDNLWQDWQQENKSISQSVALLHNHCDSQLNSLNKITSIILALEIESHKL